MRVGDSRGFPPPPRARSGVQVGGGSSEEEGGLESVLFRPHNGWLSPLGEAGALVPAAVLECELCCP